MKRLTEDIGSYVVKEIIRKWKKLNK
jgi:hypothetical protein